MEIFKLILVSAGFLIVVLGGLFLALVIGRKPKSTQASCSTESPKQQQSFGCGCGTGACGLPAGD